MNLHFGGKERFQSERAERAETLTKSPEQILGAPGFGRSLH